VFRPKNRVGVNGFNHLEPKQRSNVPMTVEGRGELKSCLAGKKFLLDCGHRFTLHPWSNTLILTASGKSSCHNCYE
jgi:hypothetical protein